VRGSTDSGGKERGGGEKKEEKIMHDILPCGQNASHPKIPAPQDNHGGNAPKELGKGGRGFTRRALTGKK